MSNPMKIPLAARVAFSAGKDHNILTISPSVAAQSSRWVRRQLAKNQRKAKKDEK